MGSRHGRFRFSRRASQTLLVLWVPALAGCTGASINTGTLVRELTDLRRLAESPSPMYRTVQYSSYDRSSNLPGGPGWFANSDGFGGEKIAGFEAVLQEPDAEGVGEYLICDVQGPGAVVRTWTAGISGDLRVYLDEGPAPLYEGPALDFLQCAYRAVARRNGMDPRLYDEGFRQRDAGYCPIPFARRCRMVWRGKIKEIHFYHVQVRCYERPAGIRTFQATDLAEFSPDLAAAAAGLMNPGGMASSPATAMAVIDAALEPGGRAEVLVLSGALALERLSLKVDAPDVDLALRQTILHVICDDYPWGQVQAPVGDFFGAAPGVNPFDTLPFTVAPDGMMTCRFIMPCKASLRVVLENRGRQRVAVTGSAQARPYEWNDRSRYFFARWRVNHGVEGSGKTPQDLPILIAQGAGRYVGTAVMLLNPCQAPTPYGGWWGEGDEKVFVDEDVVPSTFGTGSEDYFNYSWSVPDIFSFAYCGQPRNDGPGNRGFVANHRWHIIDDLPFRRRLAFYLELYPHDRVAGMSYARIGYYYARPGTIDDHVVITDDDLRPLALPPVWEPASSFGMDQAVYYSVEEIVRSSAASTTILSGPLWGGGQLLAWQPSAAGDELELRFSISKEGKYRLHLGCMLDDRSGRVSVSLDGETIAFEDAGELLDLYAPHRLLARQFSTDAVELAAGEHRLTFTFEGAEESVSAPRIGLDYLAVQPR